MWRAGRGRGGGGIAVLFLLLRLGCSFVLVVLTEEDSEQESKEVGISVEYSDMMDMMGGMVMRREKAPLRGRFIV